MTPVRRRYADLRHGQMHYREALPSGEQSGTVLMLHQVSSSSAMYEAVMPLLAARGLRCIAPDTPGFGATDPLPAGAGIHDFGDTFVEFIEALGLDEFALVGHHNGARQSVMLAARHVPGLRAVVLVNLPYHPDKTLRGERFVEKRIVDPAPDADATHVLHEWHRLGDLAREALPPRVAGMDPAHHTRELIDTLRAENYAAMYRISFSHDIEESLEAIEVPTLFVACDGDWLGKNQAAAAALVPRGEHVDLAGGVFVFDQRPHAVAEVIATYLETTSAASAQQAADAWPWGEVDGDFIN